MIKQRIHRVLEVAWEVFSRGREMVSTKRLNEVLSKILENYSFKKINILYGGSVNLSNIKDILSLQNLNGVLVGSASTKSSFIKHFK